MENSISKFEDLNVWKESMNLVEIIYNELSNSKDYGLKDQMQRAAISIPSNIAEGFERNTNKEFIHFLYIAKGSCGELRTQHYLLKNLKILDENKCNNIVELTRKISAMLSKLIKTRKEKF